MVRKKKKAASTTAVAPRRKRRAPVTAKKRTIRRRSPRKKGMAEGLAEELDFSKKESSLNKILMGTVGAFGYQALTKNTEKRKDRLIYGAAAGLAAFAFGMGKIGMGVICAAVFDYLNSPQDMAEGETKYVDPALLSDGEPAFLDAEGFPILREAYNFYGG